MLMERREKETSRFPECDVVSCMHDAGRNMTLGLVIG